MTTTICQAKGCNTIISNYNKYCYKHTDNPEYTTRYMYTDIDLTATNSITEVVLVTKQPTRIDNLQYSSSSPTPEGCCHCDCEQCESSCSWCDCGDDTVESWVIE